LRLFGKKPPYTKLIEIEPPKPAASRHGVAIVTHLKNEESYIAEWVLFHKAVGIRHFFVYDNGSTDRTQEILSGLLAKTELTVIPWVFGLKDVRNDQLLNSQVVAFAHAIRNFGSNFKWMAFIDTDEFLLPKTGRTVEEALKGANGFPNISLPWHMFGTSGHVQRPDGPVLLNYTMRAADPMSRLKNASNFKCIVDPCAVSEVSVHHFKTAQYGDATSNDAGKIFSLKERKTPQFYSNKFLQLNHYYTKSKEELEKKLSRGPASPASMQRYVTRVTIAVENIEKDQINDVEAMDFIDKHKLKFL
jgi:glycosyltransferase involved in cell wall biosynthesis